MRKEFLGWISFLSGTLGVGWFVFVAMHVSEWKEQTLYGPVIVMPVERFYWLCVWILVALGLAWFLAGTDQE